MAEGAFTWGNAGEKLTPSDRRRRIAEAMIQRGTSTAPIQHWTQGAARIAEAMLGQYDSNQIDKADKAGQASVAADAASLMGGGAPAAMPAASGAAPSMAGGGSSRTMAMPNVSPEIKDGIVQTASALGIDPVDLATTISYETGGTFDPTKRGPTTQWGQHRGLIQFGEPQAKQHGVDWNNPVGSQLGPNGAVASYLRTAGVKPGMGLLDIYSAINAGAPGLYNRSDANNGGAPGTVRDKVERQMDGHRAKARALLQAQADADMPPPDAALAEANTGQVGFVIPQGMSPVQPIPGDDPMKLRAEAQAYAQTNPEAARQMLARADAAEASMAAAMPPPRPADLAVAPPAPAMTGQTFDAITAGLPPPAPAMTGRTFNAITSGEPPLDPVFKAEGASQPWMGTTMQPQAPMVAQAPAPMPPPRPADLAAPGPVEAIGQMPPPQPQMMPDLSNSPDGGMRQLQVMAEQERQSQPAAPQEPMNPLARVAQAFTGGGQPMAPAAPQNPAVAAVAQAVGTPGASPAAASPGVDRVAAAMRVLNSPYAQPGQKAIATMVVQQAFKDPTEVESKRLALELQRKSLAGDPLDREAKQLEIEAKRKALGETKPPPTLKVKQADGSEVTLEWDAKAGTYVPLRAPLGGAAVGPAPANPFALPGKPTEAQSKDAGFAGRMVESHNLINQLEGVGVDKVQATLGAIPFVGNALSSADKQKFEQAKRNFITSILRKESGAVIADSEFATEEKKYFPQVGDSPQVIQQKRAARELAIEGVLAGAGSGYKVPETYKPTRGKADTAGKSPADGPKPPAGIDAKVWQFMTPEERALWK